MLQNTVGRLERRIARQQALSDRYSWLRLILFGGGTILSLVAFSLGGWLLFVPVLLVALVVFTVVVVYHGRLARSLDRHKIWLKIKQSQLARMNLDWAGFGSAVSSPSSGLAEHPFETDLDLTGPRSIHRLLDTASTQEGSQRLRDWLLATRPDLPTIRQHQQLVGELAPLSLFRDRLTLISRLSQVGTGERWEGRKLVEWLKLNANTPSLLRPLLLMTANCLLTLVLFILALLGVVSSIGWIVSLLVYAVLYNIYSEATRTLLSDVYVLYDGLGRLSAVLKYLEKHNYKRQPGLHQLCQPLLDPKNRPSLRLRQVNRVLVGASLIRNFPLWLILNLLVPWRYFIAHNLNLVKGQLAQALPGWLEVWFELEALSSLANFSYLNPENPFPTVTETVVPGQPVFVGHGLGHPLIPDDKRVANDFELPALGEAIIITGSNMAGKSSFLRTLGVNLVLAYAGSVVSAEELRTAPFRIFTCIKVSDSVTDGFSYFYAEVRRLKALLNALNQADQEPLFFLIDEIFRGTNNRERLIGSRSYVQALVGKHSVGMISTHDLELVHLADHNPQIKNYHFREEVIDGQMVFDYRLRSGPSPTTNALKIMQMEGLPVENFDESLAPKSART